MLTKTDGQTGCGTDKAVGKQTRKQARIERGRWRERGRHGETEKQSKTDRQTGSDTD